MTKTEEKAICELKNPFASDRITKISTYWFKGSAFLTPSWDGKITFANGNTVGEQRFTNETMAGLLVAMQAFVDSLED